MFIEVVGRLMGSLSSLHVNLVAFDSLFAGYDSVDASLSSPWPSENMVGAEFEAWSR